jgi:hypothetical protein
LGGVINLVFKNSITPSNSPLGEGEKPNITSMKKKIAKKRKTAVKKKVAKRKPTKKKVSTKRNVAKKKAKAPKTNKPIGTVTHFYNEISVAIVRFKEPIQLGAVLHFKGATTDFQHPVTSMQFDHQPITKAPKGKQIGIKVRKRVREGDLVHRVKK